MTRLVPMLCLTCAVAAAGSAYWLLVVAAKSRLDIPSAVGTQRAVPATADSEVRKALREARRSCRREPIEAVVQTLQARAATSSDAETFHLLAEALLERCLQRTHLCGMAVGTPSFAQLPKDMVDDIDSGLAAARKARELGDRDGDLFRLEAGLMSLRITGLGSALQWNGKVQAALDAAAEVDADNPHLHVAHGLQKLLAPRLLGHDPERALEHFEFAAKSMQDDERPAVFAAMASYLQKKRMQAIRWLEQAVVRNPSNTFARVVLQRLRRGEDDAFAREVTAAEAAETR